MEVIKKNPQIHKKTAALILDNGEVLWGYGLGVEKSVIGELCFNTSQTGYQEALTDPSYTKQIITFTFPHIGIVGTNSEDDESKKIYADGCVLNQPLNISSNWRAEDNLNNFFIKNNIPCIYGIDTRYITKKLADEGAKKAALINFGDNKNSLDTLKKEISKWRGLENLDLANIVSTKNKYEWDRGTWKNKLYFKDSGKFRVTCLDYGIKHNILRNLYGINLEPTVLNLASTYDEIIATKPNGIFLSNGPGDPAATGKYAIPIIKKLIKMNLPIFGICLGHQLLGLTLGAKTKKMNLGHRGANHPVKNLIKGNVEITSQNHGFEIVRKNLPRNIQITHQSLFDNSIEGIKLKSKPVFSVQYHPESNPGPQDSVYLFEEFIKTMKQNAKKKRY